MQTYEDTAVKVVYGVNELSLDLGGKSIRGIWKMLEQVLNLPRETTVRVNGQVVADDHIVRPGDEIDFLKPAGVKGHTAGVALARHRLVPPGASRCATPWCAWTVAGGSAIQRPPAASAPST